METSSTADTQRRNECATKFARPPHYWATSSSFCTVLFHIRFDGSILPLMAAPSHFLWLRDSMEVEGAQLMLAAWDAPMERLLSRHAAPLAGTLAGAFNAMRSLVGTPASRLTFQWMGLDDATSTGAFDGPSPDPSAASAAHTALATAVFKLVGGSLLVFIFPGEDHEAMRMTITSAVDALSDRIAAVVGDGVLETPPASLAPLQNETLLGVLRVQGR